MTTATTPHRLLRNGRYAAWLISDTAKGLASAFFGFAIPLIALFSTNSPAQAGIIGAVGMAVRTLTTLLGGVLADRHGRIALMVRGSVVGVALSAAFTALALADALTFATLLVLQVLLAARTGLFDVAGESALKEIVPDDAMGRAQAANQGRDALLQLTGGPLGGILLAAGAWLVGAVMAVCHLVAAATAWLLRRSTPPVEAERAVTPDPAARASAGREIAEGFRWLLARRDLRGVVAVATIINLGLSTALTTVTYALQQQGHSPVTIGFLATGAGAAMLVGAVFAPALVSKLPAGLVIIGGIVAAAAGMGALIPLHQPLHLALALAGACVFIPAVNAALMGYFMVATPSRMLGRANSASAVLSMGALPLAPLVAGVGLTLVGREATLVAAAALCTVAVLLAATNTALRALPSGHDWAAHAARFGER